MSNTTPINCPFCGTRLGSEVEDGLILIHQGHKRALVGDVKYIKCRRPIPRDGGGEMHCPGTWSPQVLAHA